MHIIRLRGPWERQIDGGEVIRVAVPDGERDGDCCSSVRYRRRFNRPTGLQPQDRVLLRVTAWRGSLHSIELNDRALNLPGQPLEIDITAMLASHNQIAFVLNAAADGVARLSGEVSLAIDDRQGIVASTPDD